MHSEDFVGKFKNSWTYLKEMWNWTKKDITELCGHLYFKNKHIYTFKKIFGNDHKNI